MPKISKKDEQEINEVLLGIWASVDQAQVQDLVNFAFRSCPYHIKKDILKDLFDYAMQEGNINVGFDAEERLELLKRAELII